MSIESTNLKTLFSLRVGNKKYDVQFHGPMDETKRKNVKTFFNTCKKIEKFRDSVSYYLPIVNEEKGSGYQWGDTTKQIAQQEIKKAQQSLQNLSFPYSTEYEELINSGATITITPI